MWSIHLPRKGPHRQWFTSDQFSPPVVRDSHPLSPDSSHWDERVPSGRTPRSERGVVMSHYRTVPLVPRNGHTLAVGIMARISGCANQKELSLDDQADHGKQEI